jgi:hypothetical protein
MNCWVDDVLKTPQTLDQVVTEGHPYLVHSCILGLIWCKVRILGGPHRTVDAIRLAMET